MDRDTFLKAINIASDYDEYVVLGGGEPTLHPNVVEFVGLAIMMCDYVSLITNGTCSKKIWKILLKAATNNPRFDLHVSKDIWHDQEKIKPWVYEDARRYNLWYGEQRESRTIINLGRAKRNLKTLLEEAQDNYKQVRVEQDELDCARIDPTGNVFVNGKKQKSFGNVCEDSYAEALTYISEQEQM